MIQVMKPTKNGRPRHLGHRRAAIGGAGVVYAAAASLTRPMTTAAEIACAIPAAVVVVQAFRWRRPLDGTRSSLALRRTAVAWAALLTLAAVWELSAWLQQPAYNIPSRDHPTVSLLLDPLTEQGPLRLAAWLGWLWAGWWLVRR
jgi:hypothetical protein